MVLGKMRISAEKEAIVESALTAAASGDGFPALLDGLPVPVYVTDADGAVTYWNAACVNFAGREPELGRDRWCVTWALFTTDGDPLPHAQCPMARAIQEKRAVRGEIAIAMRPDGSRKAFTPYPTPIFDDEGRLTGAVNVLIDVSAEQAGAIREKADRCRRLSRATHDKTAAEVLKHMAIGYDSTAAALRSGKSC